MRVGQAEGQSYEHIGLEPNIGGRVSNKRGLRGRVTPFTRWQEIWLLFALLCTLLAMLCTIPLKGAVRSDSLAAGAPFGGVSAGATAPTPAASIPRETTAGHPSDGPTPARQPTHVEPLLLLVLGAVLLYLAVAMSVLVSRLGHEKPRFGGRDAR